MSVASHLQIPLDEYDARIRTFIPGYEQMLDAAAAALRALPVARPTIVDLGTGTGALAARCMSVRPDAALVAIDEDPAILALARARLAARAATASFLQCSFLDIEVPSCHAVVASLALHHVRTSERKQQLYRQCYDAIAPGGLLVSADCMVSSDRGLDELDRTRWRAHLMRTYTEADTQGYFDAWNAEDVYFTLEREVALLREAGFAPDVIWRESPFAVVAARRP